MRKLFILTTFISSLMMSSIAHAEWTKVEEDMEGWTYYLAMDKIEVHGRKVYYWGMTNMTTPSEEGVRSGVIYYEADCKRGRYKTLTRAFYPRSMAQGNPIIINNEPDKNWNYPAPDAVDEAILKRVCFETFVQRNR